jgi:sortase B
MSENSDYKNKENKGNINKKALATLIICVIAALAAGGVWAVGAVNKSKQQSGYEELSQKTADASPENTVLEASDAYAEKSASQETEKLSSYEESVKTLSELGIPVPEKKVDFSILQEETNPDIYAWIYIPDTMIDYPVLQSADDNLYYLNYNIDGSKGYPGCIYTENYNSKDFSDPVTVMYGHNMKNGSMFAGLHKFEDGEYFDSHRYIYIYTPDKLFVYEIFASHQYSDDHILLNHDFTDSASVEKYLSEIENARDMVHNIREGVEVTAADHILTLSTCVANQSDRRYLVQGVLVNED